MSSTGLPRYWRIQVYNDTGVDSGGNIEVTAILTKTNSSGVIQYDVETDLFAAAEILADDHGDGAVKTNTDTDQYWTGFDAILDADMTGASDGNVEVWLLASTDNATWPTDRSTAHSGSAMFLGALNFTAAAQKLLYFSV